MLIEEAKWLNSVLEQIQPESGWTLLDLGSSTEYFRRVDQPYIDYYIFWPLRKLGLKIVHIDSRVAEGVDVVYDISDRDSPNVIEVVPPGDIVLCSNLLEHVLDRQMVAQRLNALTRPGGYLVVTVPHVYRYHEDPIDTGYRPDNKELEALFSNYPFNVVHSRILDVDCGYGEVPERLLPYVLFRLKSYIRLRLLKKKIRPERCKVAAIVLNKAKE